MAADGCDAMVLKDAPTPVLLTFAVACLGIVTATGGLLALSVDPDRSSSFWDFYSMEGSLPQAMAAAAVWLATSIALAVGLLQRRVWAQFLGVAVGAWSALDWLLDRVSGAEAFTVSLTPLMLWLAYALFRTDGWFVRPASTGPSPTATSS